MDKLLVVNNDIKVNIGKKLDVDHEVLFQITSPNTRGTVELYINKGNYGRIRGHLDEIFSHNESKAG